MRLTVISLDDWEGVYDEKGNLLDQGHSIRWEEVVEKLGHRVDFKYMEDPNNLQEFGNSLPDKLEDILYYIKKNDL
jgi:hypothetical protein